MLYSGCSHLGSGSRPKAQSGGLVLLHTGLGSSIYSSYGTCSEQASKDRFHSHACSANAPSKIEAPECRVELIQLGKSRSQLSQGIFAQYCGFEPRLSLHVKRIGTQDTATPIEQLQ